MVRSKRNGDLYFGICCGLAALCGIGPLLWIVYDLVKLGAGRISPGFFTDVVRESGRAGGIAPVLHSTFLIVLCCLGTAIPPGLGVAFYLTENGENRFRKWLRASVDLLATIPSIVFGLFGMAFFCRFLGLGFSILSGGLTLACMILPVLIRTTVAAVEALPDHLRSSATALGLTKTTILLRVLLPGATPGIVIGITIGTARALSETAALIFTSGYATRSPDSLLDSGRSISVHIYDLAMNIPNGAQGASASALVLLIALLLINFLTNFFSELWLKNLHSSK